MPKLTKKQLADLRAPGKVPACRDCGAPATRITRYLGKRFYDCEKCHESRGPEGLAALLRF